MRQSQGSSGAATPTEALQVVQATEPRDPRVPPAGTVLRRVFDGKAYEVTVCAEDLAEQPQPRVRLDAGLPLTRSDLPLKLRFVCRGSLARFTHEALHVRWCFQ